jgi:Pregnancy-associated plasma protein-A
LCSDDTYWRATNLHFIFYHYFTSQKLHKMKKIIQMMAMVAISYGVISCSDSSLIDSELTQSANPSGAKESGEGRQCAAMDVLEENKKEDPELEKKMKDIEDQTDDFIKKQKKSRVGATGTLTIPVVVNVLYSNANENISQAQIQSQIDVLNADFSATNSDFSSVPSAFAGVKSNLELQFTLVNVVRKASNKTSWGTRDAMKNAKKGGINPTSPSTTLNIWVCNIGGGILGYAQFPGGSLATDGVVIGPQYFGNTGFVSAPYDKGRTATHEVGHWLNLRHIWGDANCGNDQVADTPTQQTANYGCPAFPRVTCGNGPNGDMFMNYMDYTNDLCMFMFSEGQKLRTRALFAIGGARASFNP